MAAAGLLPFLAFIVERRMTQRVTERWVLAQPAGRQ